LRLLPVQTGTLLKKGEKKVRGPSIEQRKPSKDYPGHLKGGKVSEKKNGFCQKEISHGVVGFFSKKVSWGGVRKKNDRLTTTVEVYARKPRPQSLEGGGSGRTRLVQEKKSGTVKKKVI